jgi:hypothetical protein
VSAILSLSQLSHVKIQIFYSTNHNHTSNTQGNDTMPNQSFLISGRVIDTQDPAVGVAGLGVEAWSTFGLAQPVAQATTNSQGEFQMAFEAVGALSVVFKVLFNSEELLRTEEIALQPGKF